MTNKFLPVLCLPLLLAGCAASITNLTPMQQVRNANNLYPVEIAMGSSQQTVRWESHVYLRGPATLICRGEFFV